MKPITRRRFFKQSAYSSLSLAAASSAWLLLSRSVSANKWASLANQLDGQLLLPNDSAYLSTGLTENTFANTVRPAALALCANTHDVQTCIRWARQEDVPLVAQSGGHSYAGYSTTAGLMVSVRPINGVCLDPKHERATIGTGIQLGALYDRLFSNGFFVPAGRCTSVGIAGYVLGGGFGFETRQFGIASDLMLETEIVMADGEVLICNEVENSDLFWACRGGGGGNFGINTSFTMGVLPIIPTIYGKLAWSFDDAEAVWMALQEVAMMAPDAMGMRNG
ncbi:MAG: FAD-dependent oxidoreductase, partial [Cyanobacteria bacterium P01_E01_bin.34]